MIALAEHVLATARAMNAANLNRGAAGNVSARCGEGFVITPTGMAYETAMPADMVWMGFDGRTAKVANDPGAPLRRPSSEWRFHRDIYAAHPEAGAVIHAHAPFATALACQELEIPPFHYMIARFGGATVRCARYATFGTQELSDAVVDALTDRRACLMAHHGMVTFGADLAEALALAIEFEALCEQYWRVLQLGEPKLLPAEEMARVLERFRDYGRQT